MGAFKGSLVPGISVIDQVQINLNVDTLDF
ncbi:hypothetical protein [Mycobacterium lepromatosis]